MQKRILFVLLFVSGLLFGCVTSKDLPNLKVKTLSYNEESESFSITIENNGAVESPEFTVALYVDEKKIGSKDVEGLETKEETTISIDYSLDEGTYSIKAIADSENKVAETNEKDNKLVKEIVVEPKEMDLRELLNTAKEKMNNIYYEIKGTTSSFATGEIAMESTARGWEKNGNLRSESDTVWDSNRMQLFIIRKSSVIYVKSILNGVDSGWETGSEGMSISTFSDNIDYALEALDSGDLEELGEEKLGSYNTIVVEFERPSMPGSYIMTKYKYWLWKKNGIPIKIEETHEQYKHVLEFTKIDLDLEIPDSLFETE